MIRANYFLSLSLLMLVIFLVTLGSLSALGKPAVTEYNMELGQILVSFVGRHPINIVTLDGQGGGLETLIGSQDYFRGTLIESQGKFEFSQISNPLKFKVVSVFENGRLLVISEEEGGRLIVGMHSSHQGGMAFNQTGPLGGNTNSSNNNSSNNNSTNNTPNQPGPNAPPAKSSSSPPLPGEELTLKDGGKSTSSGKVQVALYTKKADKGWVIINQPIPEPTKPAAPSLKTVASRQLRISGSQALELIDEFGRSSVKRALEIRKDSAIKAINNNGNGILAGQAGGVVLSNGPESLVHVGQLNPDLLFQLHLKGPEYQGMLRDSILQLRLFHPQTGNRLRGLPVSITVSGPVQGLNDKGPIVLIDEFEYDEVTEDYIYPLLESSWLVQSREIVPGHYHVFVDVENTKHFKLTITLTEDGKFIPFQNGN